MVVAIIAILASLLLPTLGHAKENAWRTGCSSNLRQIGVAARFYADEQNGNLPVNARDGVGIAMEDNYWDSTAKKFVVNFYFSLKPYLPADAIWSCPADRLSAATLVQMKITEFVPGSPAPTIAYQGNSYAIRSFIGRSLPIPTGPCRFDSLPIPTAAKLFVDQGIHMHSVWTEVEAPPNPSTWSHGIFWPNPVHYRRSLDTNRVGNAGIQGIMADDHVDFWGGRRFLQGPGLVDPPQFRWWAYGVDPKAKEPLVH